MTRTTRGGRRIVLGLYAGIVAFAGFVGYLLATLGIATEPARYLGLVAFPPTPVGLAVYGMVTLATVLGVPLALVVIVSRRTDGA